MAEAQTAGLAFLSFFPRQVCANDLFIIAGIDMPIGKGRVRPQHIAASGGVGGLEQVRAADFFVAARGKFGDDQVAFLVEEEKAVPVFNDESVGPADGFARLRGRAYT